MIQTKTFLILGGENIAPIPIENSIKKYLPCVANTLLFAQK